MEVVFRRASRSTQLGVLRPVTEFVTVEELPLPDGEKYVANSSSDTLSDRAGLAKYLLK